MKAWYEVENETAVDSPALLIYPDRVQENIRIMMSFIDDPVRLRPHIKTNKSPQAVQMLHQAGIRKVKCATIPELRLAAEAGMTDILLAYQPTGPKVARLIEVLRSFPDITFGCLADNHRSAASLGAALTQAGLSIRVWIDLNVGMNRTGVEPGSEATDLFLCCLGIPGLEPVGLHAYDGHLRDSDLRIRTQRCDDAFQRVRETANQIRAACGKEPVICAGGTPTFPIHARRPDIECSPGTFIYWDTGYGDLLKEQPYLHAALVMTRVISKPAKDMLCLDLGHKSIAAENPLANRVTFLNGTGLEPVGQSEEHLVVRTSDADNYRVGQVLYGVPFHVCPTVALYDHAWSVRDGRAVADWHQTAREK